MSARDEWLRSMNDIDAMVSSIARTVHVGGEAKLDDQFRELRARVHRFEALCREQIKQTA
jgi:hypothetical protein